jgi:hypothetical protein
VCEKYPIFTATGSSPVARKDSETAALSAEETVKSLHRAIIADTIGRKPAEASETGPQAVLADLYSAATVQIARLYFNQDLRLRLFEKSR